MKAARSWVNARALVVFMAFLFLISPAQLSANLPAWGWLGVRIRDLSETEMEDLSIRHGLREGYGVVIVEVLGGTPAAQAGLRNGDLVVAIQGQAIVEVRALQRQVGRHKVGEEVALTVFREGRRQVLKAHVGQMPLEMVAERVAGEFGFVFRSSRVEELAGMPQTGTSQDSMVIATVLPGSPAERAELRAGDQLIRIDGSEVTTTQTLRERLASHDLEKPLALEVQRGGRAHSLLVAPPAVTDRR